MRQLAEDTVRAAGEAAGVPVVDLRGLRVQFETEMGTVHAVQDVSLVINERETLAVVGESGSGKSMTALAMMNLIPAPGEVHADHFAWRGTPMGLSELDRLRGSQVTMIFQDPIRSLNPLKTVGEQAAEVLRHRKGLSRAAARARAAELFEMVGIPEPHRRLGQFPFEFSGGMAQRVMIAMALAPQGALLIADEPTTALDVTIQAQILQLIANLQRELGIAMMLITHDLGVVAGIADRVAVMYAGRIVEEAPAAAIFDHPAHPYTAGLIACTPHPYQVRERLMTIPGSPPSIAPHVPGCAFADRCTRVTDRCRVERPPLAPVERDGAPVEVRGMVPNHKVACWHAL